MNFNEYQKAQIISLAMAAQEIARSQGIPVEYVSKEQTEVLFPLFAKYSDTPLEQQISSIKDIVNQIHLELKG